MSHLVRAYYNVLERQRRETHLGLQNRNSDGDNGIRTHISRSGGGSSSQVILYPRNYFEIKRAGFSNPALELLVNVFPRKTCLGNDLSIPKNCINNRVLFHLRLCATRLLCHHIFQVHFCMS